MCQNWEREVSDVLLIQYFINKGTMVEMTVFMPRTSLLKIALLLGVGEKIDFLEILYSRLYNFFLMLKSFFVKEKTQKQTKNKIHK